MVTFGVWPTFWPTLWVKKKPSLPNLRIYYKILWNKLDFYLSGPRPIRIKPNVGHDPWPLSGPQLTSRIWKFPIKTPTMLNCVAQSLDTTYGLHLSRNQAPTNAYQMRSSVL